MATADGAAMPAAEGYRRMQEALRIRQLQEEAQRAEAEQEAAAAAPLPPAPLTLPAGGPPGGPPETLTMPGMPEPAAAPRPRMPTADEAAAARRNTPDAQREARRQEELRANQQAAEARQQAAGQRQRDFSASAAQRTADIARPTRMLDARLDLNADPEKVEADRQAALEIARRPKPADPVKDTEARRDRAQLADDTRQYQQNMAAWDAERRALEAKKEQAIAAFRPRAEIAAIDETLKRHAAVMPQPTARILDGQTVQELAEPVAATVGRLPPAQQKQLLEMYTRNYLPVGRPATAEEQAEARRRADEDMVASYDSMEPDERLQAMSAHAANNSSPAPMTYGGEDASVRGGKGAGIGDYARNEDMDPNTRRMVGRDVTYGDPVRNEPGVRGGTFVQNPTGSFSTRAPNPDQLAAAGLSAQDQNGNYLIPSTPGPGQMTRQWRESMKIAGATLGLDPSGFDNEDAFIAAAARHLQRHRDTLKNYDVVPVITGGFRYTPNAARQEQAAGRRRHEFARTLITRYGDVRNGGLIDGAALAQLAEQPNGFEEMQKLAQLARLQLTGDQQAAWRARQNTFNMTRDMANPRFAPGMAVRSLVNAVNSGDPMQLGVAYDIAGNRRGARDAFDLAMAERAGAAQVAAARAANADGTPADALVADQMNPQIERALTLPQGQRDAVIARVLRGMGFPQEEIPQRLSEIILDYEIRTNPQGPIVKSRLESLRRNPAELRAFLERMGYGPAEAAAIERQATAPSDASRAAAKAAAQAVAGPAGQALAEWLGF